MSSSASLLRSTLVSLRRLDSQTPHTFTIPIKRINDGADVSSFLSSKAYVQIMTFLLQLNASLYPRIVHSGGSSEEKVQAWELDSPDIKFSEAVIRLRELLRKLESIIDEAPPDPGPRRFGNMSFRKWFEIVESRLPSLLAECLPDALAIEYAEPQTVKAQDELMAYLIGAFGSAQRLDYGTGHELSFLAFLACVWMLGGFPQSEPGVEERGIVFGVIEPYVSTSPGIRTFLPRKTVSDLHAMHYRYLNLIRRLIKTYTLEPAGSHGVWGLDDHSFQPYIFGSAQLCPPISLLDQLSSEGSLFGAPDPDGIAKAAIVHRERKRNMYFSAVGFIYDVKNGPFWEHSPYLFDISGVRGGWAKINKVGIPHPTIPTREYDLRVVQGMIKMYNAEVLSKFPVVQHFPFGSLFSWDRDPNAQPPAPSTHTSSQPMKSPSATSLETKDSVRRLTQEEIRAPWVSATHLPTPTPQTAAPWASRPSATALTATTRIRATEPKRNGEQPLGAPWANQRSPALLPAAGGEMRTITGSATSKSDGNTIMPTRAPWVEKSIEDQDRV
ncbi:MAG: Serine/threonine-protein phosphatase 2A activator 1 [Geoglossum umbratile]|nr:MAG: Serine/threonine-protein phosphatase 2A activator 1 [Geoglossum umbratile]